MTLNNPNLVTTRNLTAALIALVALTAAALPAFAEESVNVNEAAESQLALLPRVGPAMAARIVEFRDANGKFKDVEDLLLVRGIGEKTMELLRPFVTTSGKTTLSGKVSISRAEEAASTASPSSSSAKPAKKDDAKSDG